MNGLILFGWMDGWMNGLILFGYMDGWMDGWLGVAVCRWTDK